MGNDSRTITQAQSPSTPWASLSKIQSSISSLGANDSILFMRNNSFRGTLSMFNKNRMYFGAYGTGRNPLFWGTGVAITTMFRLTQCSNVIFENLLISDTTISQTDRTIQAKIQRVFIIESNSQNNRVVSCTMDRIGYGIYITPRSNGQVIERCDIGNLRMIKNTPTTVNADDDFGGVPIQISSRNNRVVSNFFHDCYSVSYDYRFDGGGIEFFEEGDTISGNEIMFNTFFDNNGTLEHGSSNDGIANNPIINNLFAYNKVINCEGLVYVNNRGQYRTRVKNLMVYNNVVVETKVPRLGVGRLVSMATSDTTIGIVNMRNTIFRITNGFAVAKSTIFTGAQLTRFNNLYQLGTGSVLNFTLNSTEISSLTPVWSNMTSSNPINWNYSPLAGSVIIKRGIWVNLTRDFNGAIVSNPPDIGILQSTSLIATTSTIKYPEVHSLYYNPISRSIFVNVDTTGIMAISGQVGNRVRNVYYNAYGDWINVARLNSGIYYASTYGRSIAFIR